MSKIIKIKVSKEQRMKNTKIIKCIRNVKQNHKNLMKELSDKYDEFEEDFITKLPNWFEYSRDEDVFELSFDYICDILADIDEDEYEWFVEYYSTLKTSNPFFKINNPITNTYLLKEYLKR
jgi:hypothetical protein